MKKTETLTAEEKEKRVKICREMVIINDKRIHTFLADEMGSVSLKFIEKNMSGTHPEKKVKTKNFFQMLD